MLIAHAHTAVAITPHAANRSWVVFLETQIPVGVRPIRIVGWNGHEIGRELRLVSAANAYDVTIIGLIPTLQDPAQHALAIGEQYAGQHLHDGWYLPSADLLAFIQHHARPALQELLAQVHPGAINEHVVDIDEMARLLNVSTTTIRRLVKSEEIPFMRWGRALRFVPADVIATLQQRGRAR